MKVFWSWQSDTPGKIGRHFVRDVLEDAITALKEPKNIEEPSERETREAMHLDHDRKGVAGTPDLAPTIFEKIDRAAVFVADVTLVGESLVSAKANEETRPKKLINSNVGIEYGYALRALTGSRILLVQNIHYGGREELPFDLKYKAGPIQFCLCPGATKTEISAEHARLRATFIEALRPYIDEVSRVPPSFEEIPSMANIAFYWGPGDVLASQENDILRLYGRSHDEEKIEYRFNDLPAFYMRLIPTASLPEPLEVTKLFELVNRRGVRVLTRAGFGGVPARNRFGSIAYEVHGNDTVPKAFTQLFRNGEIWGVSSAFVAKYKGELVVAMVDTKNIFEGTLANFVEVAHNEIGVVTPYQIEIGAVGLKDMCLTLPETKREWLHRMSGPIHEDQLQFRRVLNELTVPAQNKLVEEFLRRLYDLAGVSL